ncbi:hypothetical protein [Nocardia otitidiscaviarum]|uniref:hypothetical protein n=1 Tax=Nocardia otitidiscaviarum TaxID=1823 RepID=UPI000693EF0D|nr:hypothetical protein [Nocardia otitidiscaviarum]
MTNPLPPLVYGKVVGRFLGGITDSPDVDNLPDFPPLTGLVYFSADVPKYLVQSAEPPASVVPLNGDHMVVTLDDEGYLTWRGERGVKLPAPVAGTMNPSGWTYRVSFALKYLGQPVNLAPYYIQVPEYTPGPDPEDPDTGSTGLVDLAMVSPVPSSDGNAVVRGVSISSVNVVGNAIVVGLDDGSTLPGVEVPAIQDALDAADAADASATAAAGSATTAQNAVNSFDLDVVNVTTLSPGSPATASVYGGPPAWSVDFGIPKGDTGDPGPAAPDADATTKGIVQLAGDLTGTAASPAVANNAITTAKIPDGAVTVAKLNADVTPAMQNLIDTSTSVTSKYTLPGGGLPAADLATDAVTTVKIQDGAVTSAKIADGTIADADINASAAIAISKLATGRVQGSKNGVATNITIWCGTEAQYNTATSNGASEDPNTLYFRSA